MLISPPGEWLEWSAALSSVGEFQIPMLDAVLDSGRALGMEFERICLDQQPRLRSNKRLLNEEEN